MNPFDDTAIVTDYEKWYATTGKHADRLEKSLLKRILSHFPTSHTLLEVGCGTGHFTRWFADQDLLVTGVDISQTMLNEAKRIQPLSCIRTNGLLLPFSNNVYDLVVYITCLEFLNDPTGAIKEGLRVARDGLILGALNRKSLLGHNLQQKGGPIWKNVHLFSIRELTDLITSLGIKRENIFWRTTLLWNTPWSTHLPFGGFIGMAVMINQE